jgi:hypothetical protein
LRGRPLIPGQRGHGLGIGGGIGRGRLGITPEWTLLGLKPWRK